MNFWSEVLPSGREFQLNLNLNHPSILPGAQGVVESILFQGGKLFRPRLCFMMAEAIQLPFENIAAYARVAELVHGATLAHDDVIDQATERRKKLTLNSRLTQARAVLAGDLMLSRAMVELSTLGNTAILNRMAEVLEDLVTGEWLQLENRGFLEVSEMALEVIARYKTASMIEWCVEVPFHLMNSDSKTISIARKFGRALGLAFQYRDDCLDFSLDSGKPFAQDLSEGLINQVTFILIKENPNFKHFIRSFMESENEIERGSFLKQVGELKLNQAIAQVKEKATREVQFAKEALRELEQLSLNKSSFMHLDVLLLELLERKG